MGWNGHTQEGGTLGSVDGNFLLLSPSFYASLLILDILKNISLNWNKIVKGITIYTNENYEKISIQGEKIHWKMVAQYPSCQTIDLFDFFNSEKRAIKEIHFKFNMVKNMGVTLLIEDRIRATSRTLQENMMTYFGPALDYQDLMKPFFNRAIISISQVIYSELDQDKNCTNYPNKYYTSFKECDM